MSGLRYTPGMLEFLQSGYMSMLVPELTRAFNASFSTDQQPGQIKSTLKNHGIKCGRQCGKKTWGSILFTPDQDRFMRENYPSCFVTDLATALNREFGTVKTVAQVRNYLHRMGINSGRDGRFDKQHLPWNAGTKGQGLTGANIRSFKKGAVPPNRKRLWTERIDSKDGFIVIKVPETDPYTGFPTRYKHKHVWLWECHHGPVPTGMVVSFRDGKRLNCEPENLVLISREELLQLNLYNYREQPAEVKPTILAMVKLNVKAGIRGISANGAGRKKRAAEG